MPGVFSKATVWPLADTEGRSCKAPHTADGQNVLTTPVLGLRVSRSPVAKFWKTTGPLVPGNAACADGAAATAAKPAMVPVARSVPKRPRHLFLNADTLLTPRVGVGYVRRLPP